MGTPALSECLTNIARVTCNERGKRGNRENDFFACLTFNVFDLLRRVVRFKKIFKGQIWQPCCFVSGQHLIFVFEAKRSALCVIV